jgi:glycosyltransferase involved in cell wall biosynthesis
VHPGFGQRTSGEGRHLREIGVNKSERETDGKALTPTVAIVIPTFNRAMYLRDALRSVFAQTYPVDEIIVVDDGSSDETPSVVAEFTGVIFLHQNNRGPSEARNVGIRAAKSAYVLCLDSDDVLVPDGIENSLACLAENPGVAFVYGGHRRVDAALRPIDHPYFTPMSGNAYHDLLQNNSVYMLGTVLFDRAKLLEVGGFDPRIRRCEDYDLFLRLARKFPVASDPAVVAHYRIHGDSLSARSDEMLIAALAAQDRNRPDDGDIEGLRAYRRGKKMLVRTFAVGAWRAKPSAAHARKWEERLGMARIAPFSTVAAAAWQSARRHLPRPLVDRLKAMLRRQVPLGTVDMGDLRRTRPISRCAGYDRGTPVDRYYLEKFLARWSRDITGRVLEVGDDGYTRRFGSNVSTTDILHVTPDRKDATIVGDLGKPGTLPPSTFDCMLIIHTLQFVYDLPLALREIRQALRPDGVALLAIPGVAWVDRSEFTQLWSFTVPVAVRLFTDAFGAENVEVEAFGNVYAVTCFLYGLALEEIERDWLDKFDPTYPLVITVRARRAS